MWAYLFGFTALSVAVLGAVFFIRRSGKAAQRLEDAQRALQGEQRRNEIDENVVGMSDDDLDRILRESQRYDL